jgi:signal peptidase I
MRREKGVGILELLSSLIVVIGLFLGGVSAWAGMSDVPGKLSQPGMSDNDVILYTNTNYGGRQLKYTADTQVPDLRQIQLVTSGGSVNWNDQISSIQVGKNKKIVLYKY